MMIEDEVLAIMQEDEKQLSIVYDLSLPRPLSDKIKIQTLPSLANGKLDQEDKEYQLIVVPPMDVKGSGYTILRGKSIDELKDKLQKYFDKLGYIVNDIYISESNECEIKSVKEDLKGTNLVDAAKALAYKLGNLDADKVNDYVFILKLNEIAPLAQRVVSELREFLNSDRACEIFSKYAESLADAIAARLEIEGYNIIDIVDSGEEQPITGMSYWVRFQDKYDAKFQVTAKINMFNSKFYAYALLTKEGKSMDKFEIELSEDATIASQLADSVVNSLKTIV